MDKVKLSFDFLITMIFTLLLAACGGNGGDFSSDASLVSLTLWVAK
jgi:ABC-type glycerol-3-phosphate transport system substrate-binding protein